MRWDGVSQRESAASDRMPRGLAEPAPEFRRGAPIASRSTKQQKHPALLLLLDEHQRFTKFLPLSRTLFGRTFPAPDPIHRFRPKHLRPQHKSHQIFQWFYFKDTSAYFVPRDDKRPVGQDGTGECHIPAARCPHEPIVLRSNGRWLCKMPFIQLISIKSNSNEKNVRHTFEWNEMTNASEWVQSWLVNWCAVLLTWGRNARNNGLLLVQCWPRATYLRRVHRRPAGQLHRSLNTPIHWSFG